jgi:hypothetical protein
MLFSCLYPGRNGDFNESKTVDIGVKNRATQQLFMLMVGLRMVMHDASMP